MVNIWTSYAERESILYEWADGLEQLDYEGIPPIEAFCSQLKNESVLYDDDDKEDDDDEKDKKLRKSSSKRTTITVGKFIQL